MNQTMTAEEVEERERELVSEEEKRLGSLVTHPGGKELLKTLLERMGFTLNMLTNSKMVLDAPEKMKFYAGKQAAYRELYDLILQAATSAGYVRLNAEDGLTWLAQAVLGAEDEGQETIHE